MIGRKIVEIGQSACFFLLATHRLNEWMNLAGSISFFFFCQITSFCTFEPLLGCVESVIMGIKVL